MQIYKAQVMPKIIPTKCWSLHND